MIDRTISSMTRSELEDEVRLLRAAFSRLGGNVGLGGTHQADRHRDDDPFETIARRRNGDFVALEMGKGAAQKRISRKFVGRLPADQRLSRDAANER
tara:strand:+ start:883 stop:1173 length:291 start_codon:yes stop_codon:yes gene_type:complete